VQRLPSSQAAPSATGSDGEQAPLGTSQVRCWWHWSSAWQPSSEEQAQVLTVAVQRPARQASPAVQERPSSQAAPSVAGGSEHSPVVGSQVPAARQVALGTQVTGSPPVQRPASHVSDRVQALPSSHGVPSGLAG